MRLVASIRTYEFRQIKVFLLALFLGIASGLPFSLLASTLTVRLSQYGINKASLGIFSLASLPYALKFLLAPLVDWEPTKICNLFNLGKRQSWMLLIQVLLSLSIMSLGLTNPSSEPYLLFASAFSVCLFAALNDIVMDGYRIESVPSELLGVAASASVFGYRVGMLISGGLLLILVGTLSFGTLDQKWIIAHSFVSIGVLTGFIVSLIYGEQKNLAIQKKEPFRWKIFIKNRVIEPYASFCQIKGWLVIAFFIATYKIGDAFYGFLFSPFLLDIGFSIETLGFVSKVVRMGAYIVGTLIGGVLFYRLGPRNSLLICGLLGVASNGLSIVQAHYGAVIGLLYFTVILEELFQSASGLCLASFIAILCKGSSHVATQFALLTSLIAVARIIIPSLGGGYIADQYGWETFFLVSMLLPLPTLSLLIFTPYFSCKEKDNKLATVNKMAKV